MSTSKNTIGHQTQNFESRVENTLLNIISHLSTMQSQVDELLEEVRNLKQLSIPVETNPSAVPPAVQVSPSTYARPTIGDAVYVSGPSHNPIFRCPITLIDGGKTYGPEAHSKSLAKFLAQQQVLNVQPEFYKPGALTAQHLGTLCALAVLQFLSQISYPSDLVLEPLNSKYIHDDTTLAQRILHPIDTTINSTKILHNNLKHDYNVYKRQKIQNEAKDFARRNHLQYLADKNGKEYFLDEEVIKPKMFKSQPLVGVELNPGPGNKKNKKNSRMERKIEKKVEKKLEKQMVKKIVTHNPRKALPFVAKVVTDGLNKGVQVSNRVVRDVFNRRREKVMDVTGTTTPFLLLASLVINPANNVAFPIFSGAAKMYEMYNQGRMGIHFIYEGEAYTASGTSSTAGILMLAFNPDVDDALPISSKQMEDYGISRKGPIYSKRLVLSVRPNSPFKKHFVYFSENIPGPTGVGNKFYDLGSLHVAVANNATTNVYGELFVEFSFVMHILKSPDDGLANGFAHITENPNGTANAANPLGTTGGVIGAGDTLPVAPTTSSFHLPVQGDYILFGIWSNSTGTISANGGYGLGTNIVLVSSFQDYATSFVNVFNASVAMSVAYVRVNANGSGVANIVNITGLTGMTLAKTDIYVLPYSPTALRENKYIALRRNPMNTINGNQLLMQDQARIRGLESMVMKLMRTAELRRSLEVDDEKYIRASTPDSTGMVYVPAPRLVGIEPNPGPVFIVPPEPPPPGSLSDSDDDVGHEMIDSVIVDVDLADDEHCYCSICEELNWSSNEYKSHMLNTSYDMGQIIGVMRARSLYLGLWVLNGHWLLLREVRSNRFFRPENSFDDMYVAMVNKLTIKTIEMFSFYNIDKLEPVYDPIVHDIIVKTQEGEAYDEYTIEKRDSSVVNVRIAAEYVSNLSFTDVIVPAPRLVGIEPNPGPADYRSDEEVESKYDLVSPSIAVSDSVVHSDEKDFPPLRSETCSFVYVTSIEDIVKKHYTGLKQIVPLWCETTDEVQRYANDNGIELDCTCNLKKMYNSKYRRFACTVCDIPDPKLHPPIMRFRQVKKFCAVCGEENWFMSSHKGPDTCETCEIVKRLCGDKEEKPVVNEQKIPIIPQTMPIPEKKPVKNYPWTNVMVGEPTVKKAEVKLHPDNMTHEQLSRMLQEHKKDNKENPLEREILDTKLTDIIESNASIHTGPPELQHSIVQCKNIISNNENRKIVPTMKCYYIALHRYDRYPKDENGHVVYGRRFFSNEEEGNDDANFLTPMWFPSTVVPELEAFYNGHTTIDENIFKIARQVCIRLCRPLDFAAEAQAQTICWAPIVAHERVFLRNQLANPFSKLPYVTSGGMFNQLSIINHEYYPNKRYPRLSHPRVVRRNPLNKPVGPIEVVKHKNPLVRHWELLKLPFKKLKNYFDTRALKKKLDADGVIFDEQQHNMLKYANPVLPRRNWSYRKQVPWDCITINFSIKDFKVTSQISGTHGSWTRDDDVLYYKHINSNISTDPPQKEKSGLWYPLFDQYSHKKLDNEPMLQCSYFWNHGYRPVCFSNNLHNERITIVNRVTVETPKPDEEFLRDFISWCKKNFKSLMNNKVKKIKPVSDEVYLARSNASPQMKQKWMETRDEMAANGYVGATDIDLALAWLWATRKLFIKKENLPYKTPAGMKNKAPRAIQGLKTLHYLVILGPWFMALQDHIKTIFNKSNWACFTSGVDAVDAAAVLEEFWTVIEDDISTFDSSVDIKLCDFEVWMTEQFGATSIILKLMRANNKTHGVTMLGGKYWVPGARKSGDPFTSLYNTLLNIFMHAFILHKHYGWDLETIKQRTRMVAAGDDNLMTINAQAVDFVSYMKKLGFNSEAIVRHSLADAEFCSCRLFFLQGKWVFAPMAGKVLSKFGFLNNPPKNVSRESMLKGIATGLLRACSFIPPIRAVIARVFELTANHKEYQGKLTRFKTDFWNMHFDLTAFDQHFDPDMYASLYLTYGWTYEMQINFESELSQVQLDDVIPKNSFVNILFDRDTAGPHVMAA